MAATKKRSLGHTPEFLEQKKAWAEEDRTKKEALETWEGTSFSEKTTDATELLKKQAVDTTIISAMSAYETFLKVKNPLSLLTIAPRTGLKITANNVFHTWQYAAKHNHRAHKLNDKLTRYVESHDRLRKKINSSFSHPALQDFSLRNVLQNEFFGAVELMKTRHFNTNIKQLMKNGPSIEGEPVLCHTRNYG